MKQNLMKKTNHYNIAKYLNSAIICAACGLALADNQSQSYIQDLYNTLKITGTEQDILQQDMSIMILSSIFGSMGELLVGTQQTIFGRLFYLFNNACISIAALSISYASTIIAIQTAGEGTALGKKLQQSYFYFLFREVTSIMLMLPGFNGYSGIQMMLMWMVIQGIHLADIVWLNAAQYVMSAQNIAANVLDVANENPELLQIMQLSNSEQISSPTQLQIAAASNFSSYIYEASICATLYPLTEGKSIDYLNFSNINIYQDLNKYIISFPNNCGNITISYNNLPNNLSSKQQQDLIENVANSVKIATQTIMDYVSSTISTLESNGCISTIAQNTNISQLPENCIMPCNSSNCQILNSFTNVIRNLASSIQIQSSMTNTMDNPETPSVKNLYGVGWIGVATQYYKGMHELNNSQIKNDSTGFSISDYTVLSIVNYSGLVTAFSSELKNALKLMQTSSLLEKPITLCDDKNTKNPFAQWYCQANTVTQQTENIISSLWSSIGVHHIGFDQSPSWSQMTNNYTSALNSQTSNKVEWAGISESFWPLMSTYHISASNAWIRTFLNPAYLKNMITDPLYTFSQLAKFLTASSITYMTKATGEAAKDLFLFASEVMVTTSMIAIPAVLIDATAAQTQGFSFFEQNACWEDTSEMEYIMMPVCIIIVLLCFPIIINLIIGLFINTLSTIWRLAFKSIFDITMSVLDMMTEIGIAYKLRYISLIFSVATPVLTLSSYLTVYIPMLPVLMYTIAVIGWIAAIIEAMIGVPLVLLGMTSMQGHDLFGSAQQTMILLLSVFIRPVTLVMGFIFGVVMLSMFGFAMAMFFVPYLGNQLNIMQNSQLDHLSEAIILAMIMLIYISVYATMIQLAFGAMFKIPYAILRWIGLTGASGGEEEILETIQSESRSQLGSMSGMLSGMQGGLHKSSSSAHAGKTSLTQLGERKSDD